tara:strand:+ start:454 stop:696 length:243 start_codon:yes stop_codon:yes gene_type:complete
MQTRSGFSYVVKDSNTNYYLNLANTFQEWKNKINELVLTQINLGCEDLPDIDYYNLFVEGVPEEQVKNKLVYDFYIDMLN